MRTFSTGATRNNVEGKLSYFRALSPAVLQRYVQYLAKHRKQVGSDTLRSFDNWKHGIPEDEYMDSLLRHVFTLWLLTHGNKIDERITIEDVLCAIVFNANGLLFEMLVKQGNTRENPIPVITAAGVKTPTLLCCDCIEIEPGGRCDDGDPSWPVRKCLHFKSRVSA